MFHVTSIDISNTLYTSFTHSQEYYSCEQDKCWLNDISQINIIHVDRTMTKWPLPGLLFWTGIGLETQILKWCLRKSLFSVTDMEEEPQNSDFKLPGLSRTGNTKLVLFKSSQNFRHWAVIQYDLQCLKDKQTSWLTLILQDFCTYQGTESTYHKTKQRLQKKTKKKVCNVSKFNHTTIMQAVSIFSSRGFLRVFRTLAVLQPYTVPSVKPLKL